MVDATVDNTPVTVLLSDGETYTPASGSVQKVTVVVSVFERLGVQQGGTSQRLVGSNSGSGEPNAGTVEMIIDDTVTLQEDGQSGSHGIYISGFEVA